MYEALGFMFACDIASKADGDTMMNLRYMYGSLLEGNEKEAEPEKYSKEFLQLDSDGSDT